MDSCHYLLRPGCRIQNGHRVQLQRQKGTNENDDDLTLLLCLCMRFGTYNHIKREHVETIIQTVSFPFLIGLLDWWIGDGFGSRESWFLKSTWQDSPLAQFKFLPFQEAPRAPAMGLSSHYFKCWQSCDLLLCSTDTSLPFDRVLYVCSRQSPRLGCWRSVFPVLWSWPTTEGSISALDFAVRPTRIQALALPLTSGVCLNSYFLWVSISSVNLS